MGRACGGDVSRVRCARLDRRRARVAIAPVGAAARDLCLGAQAQRCNLFHKTSRLKEHSA